MLQAVSNDDISISKLCNLMTIAAEKKLIGENSHEKDNVLFLFINNFDRNINTSSAK